ncbi:50S ribosomal protein L30 [Hutsoniella sourekii]|uniref:50S ribosomal protein L30 n=1 Tax=Hutsoniella sourekii TaxID=87650 RepID=UPI000486F660|nr:50S ribosomal protein L30 [Hutsoniella sourekii]
MANLEIKLKRSLIGRQKNQIATAKSLGLNKIGQTVVQEDNEAIRGMINRIQHLVEVKEA